MSNYSSLLNKNHSTAKSNLQGSNKYASQTGLIVHAKCCDEYWQKQSRINASEEVDHLDKLGKSQYELWGCQSSSEEIQDRRYAENAKLFRNHGMILFTHGRAGSIS